MPFITFESVRLLREFNDIDGRLYEIVVTLIERFWPDASKPAVIDCIFRTQAEEIAAGGKTGIHMAGPPYRAVDIRGHEFTQAQLDAAHAAINAIWEYDFQRPEMTVCFTAPHGTGPHFHVQVHQNTRKRDASS